MININILGIIILVAFIIFLVLFIMAIVATLRVRKNKRSLINEKECKYPTACAGSPIKDVPPSASSFPLDYIEFKDKDGNILNPANYRQFIARGESMQFADIHDNDMIFTQQHKDLKFPHVVVLRREIAPPDQVQYKIRRGWQFCNIDNAEEIVKQILQSKEFDIIRNLQPYDGDDTLLEDFKNKRLVRYIKEHPFARSSEDKYFKVIISTTYHTENCPEIEDRCKIRFSIHPASLMVGEVVESFAL